MNRKIFRFASLVLWFVSLAAGSNGDGTLQTGLSFPVVGLAPSSVAVVDVNGDGVPDVIVANQGSNNVSVHLGNGDGTFQTGLSFPVVGLAPSSVAVDPSDQFVIATNLLSNSAQSSASTLTTR